MQNNNSIFMKNIVLFGVSIRKTGVLYSEGKS